MGTIQMVITVFLFSFMNHTSKARRDLAVRSIQWGGQVFPASCFHLLRLRFLSSTYRYSSSPFCFHLLKLRFLSTYRYSFSSSSPFHPQALFCTGACVSWIVQFRTKLRKNVLTPEELEDGWSSESRAKLGYSFFLVVVTLGLFLFNIFLVSLASRKRATKYWDSSKQRISHRSIGDKNPEGVIMLY